MNQPDTLQEEIPELTDVIGVYLPDVQKMDTEALIKHLLAMAHERNIVMPKYGDMDIDRVQGFVKKIENIQNVYPGQLIDLVLHYEAKIMAVEAESMKMVLMRQVMRDVIKEEMQNA